MGFNFNFLKTAAKDAGHAASTVARGDNKPGGGAFGFLNDAIQTESKVKQNLQQKTGGSNPALGEKVFHFIGSTAQSVPRGVLEIGQTLTQPITHNPSINPQDLGPIGTIILGKSPVTTSTQAAKDLGQALPGHKTLPTGAALPLGLALSTPLFGGKKSIAEQLAKADTVSAVKKIIPGVEDSKAQAIASQKDPQMIDNILQGKNQVTRPAPIPPAPKPTPSEGANAPGQGIAELPKRANAVQRATLSVTGELSKQGPAGQEIADRLSKARDISERGQAEFIQKIPTVLKLKGNEFHDFHDALAAADKGETIKTSPQVAQAVKEWTANIPSVRDKAIGAGLDVGNLGPNYFPRNYTELLKSDEGRNIAAEHLVKTGQADTLGEAAMTLDNMKLKYNTPFGHFENSRTSDLPGYDISKDAIINYINGAYNKIGHATQFGPRNEGAKELITTLGKEGHDINRALRNFQIASGTKQYDSGAIDTASKALRGFNRLRSLGLSALLNATQTNNTAAVTGIWRTAGAAFKHFTPDEKQYIKDTGVIIDSVLNNLREATGLSGKITGKITAPAFSTVEKFNRSVAAVAGKNYANKLADRAVSGDAKATSVLRNKLGIEGDIGTKLTKEQEIQAGRKIVELTQFKVDPQDLPGWTNSSGGKLVAQFRTFQYKQTGFVFNQLLKEAKNGNPAPLARFIAIGIPLGVGAGAVRNTLKGQPGVGTKGDQEHPSVNHFSQAMEGLANVGAFGLGPTDAKFLAQNSKSQRFPEYVAGVTGGPTAGFTVGTVTDIGKATAGDAKPLERRGLKALSSPGPYLQNKLLPYSALNKSQGNIIAELKKEGADKNTITAYNSFFNVKTPKSPSKQLDAAILQGDFNKAQSIADAYNEQLAKAYDKWANKYGQYAPQDLQSRYDSKKLNLSESKINSVYRSNQKSNNLLGGQ